MILICCSSDCRGPPNGGDPIDPTRLDVDSWPVATPASGRQLFLDGLRGLALIFMVLNHTGRWWIERPLGWPRYHLVYLTVTLAAPIFLFLVGFCLPLSYLNSTLTRGERYVSVAWKYVRRGARLVVAGWFLNLLVFPDEPLFAGGVLQTIGLSIVGLTLLLPLLRRRAAGWALLAAALSVYASFALAHPFLRRWLTRHPVVAAVWFSDFPLWPWLAVALLGVVLGWVWAEGQRRGDDDRRYFGMMSLAGVLCLAAFLALELAVGPTPHFYSGREVVLGQNALMLYFVHQVIVLTFLRQRFGVLFHSWWAYGLANALLIAALVVLAQVWPPFKRRALALVRGSVQRRTSAAERRQEAL